MKAKFYFKTLKFFLKSPVFISKLLFCIFIGFFFSFSLFLSSNYPYKMGTNNMDPSYNEIQTDEEFLIACDFGTLVQSKNRSKQSTPKKKPVTNPFHDGFKPVLITGFGNLLLRGDDEVDSDVVASPSSNQPENIWDVTGPVSGGDPNSPDFWVADQPMIPLDDPANPWMDLLK